MPDATVTTGSASIKSSTEVTLSGSFANATGMPVEVGFWYGTSSNNLNQNVTASLPSGTPGDFSVTLTGLVPGETYVYQAYAIVQGTGVYSSQVKTFWAPSTQFVEMPGGVKPAVDEDWLELATAPELGNRYEVETYYDGSNRNYTHCYDKSTYTSIWTAYPLNSTHMGSLSRPGSWNYSPNISEEYQANLCSHSYSGDTYSRGHMIPNGSRNGNSVMQKQTFYVTNSVPQRQNKFNGSIWNALEQALQSVAKSEEIYIVTGVAFNKVGETKTVSYVSPADDSSQKCAIPNYFYKVVLKVNKSGDTVTSASTIGFWFEHKDYDNSAYENYAVSVDQIEAWTGFDFFVNLPDAIENSSESNAYWSTFQSF